MKIRGHDCEHPTIEGRPCAICAMHYARRGQAIASSEIACLRNELDHVQRRLRAAWDALAWMEERAQNSTSYGSHCHAYEIAAKKLREAMEPT